MHICRQIKISPVHKKENPLLAKNYRPVECFANSYWNIWKINAKSTQWTYQSVCLDNKGYTGAVLMDLSMAFNTINY